MDPATPPVPIETLLADRPWVRALARSLVRDDATADDVSQDAYVAALRHPPRDASTARGWFAVVARNLARAESRGSSRRAAREEAVARPERVAAADDVVAAAEIHRRVVEAVMQLAEPYRSTVLLRYFEGLESAEIAARTGTPLETVRTRLRRALALLRERLAPHDDHDARGALLVLAGPSGIGAEAGPARPSRRLRGLVAAGLVAATAAAIAVAVRWDAARHSAGGASSAFVAAAPDGGGPVPPAPPPPPPPVPAPGSDADTPPAPREPASGAAPSAPAPEAPVAGDGALRLSVTTEPALPRAGEPFEFVATFENTGTAPAGVFLPLHAYVFPAFSLRADDGTEFAPADWIGQSMWQKGMQGSLVEIAPGASWTKRSRVEEFTPRGPGGTADWRVRSPLAPGRYVVTCSYTRASQDLPFSDKAFEVVTRRVAGVWTGRAAAPEVALAVEPALRASLSIEAPREVVAGAPFVADVTAHNPGETEVVFDGGVVVRAYAKAEGALLERRAAAADAAGLVRVPPRGRVSWRVDCRFDDVLLRRRLGTVVLLASIESGPGRESITSNARWLAVRTLGDASASGLAATATLAVGADGPEAVVTFENRGDGVLRVPANLGGRSALAFRVRRSGANAGESIALTDQRGTLTVGSYEWTTPADGAAATEFARLAPGERHVVRAPIFRAGAPALPAGEYELVVTWRSTDEGPADAAPAVVGALAAPPLTLVR